MHPAACVPYTPGKGHRVVARVSSRHALNVTSMNDSGSWTYLFENVRVVGKWIIWE